MTFVGSDDVHTLLLVDIIECNVPNLQNVKSWNVLLKILQNIRQHPEEDKYRHLKKSNAAIASVLDLVGVKEFLSSIGFEEAPESWEYEPTEDSYLTINKVYNLLNSRLGSIEVVGDLDPAIEKLVKESKLKYEKEKEYKQKILDQMKLDRKDHRERLQQEKKKKNGRR